MPTLDFKGKQFVYSHHLSVPFRALKLVPEKSLPVEGRKPSLDDNLIIHGDNLEALKALLPTHAGKVDCIFIDPPYNTGNEGWRYNDNVRSPLMQEWLKTSANPVDKEDLERHDKWLCMMWPRLNLLRELLAPSGVIIITIDENEEHRLRGILDEVFGNENYLGTIVWQKRQSPDSDEDQVTRTHDNLLLFAREISSVEKLRFQRTEETDARYTNPDNDPRGPWTSSDLTRREYREHDYYGITLPSGREVWPAQGRSWSVPKETFDKLKKQNRLWFGESGEAMPRRKRFLSEVRGGVVSTTWWTTSEAGSNGDAKKELSKIFREEPDVFATPKPVRLLSKILELTTDENAISWTPSPAPAPPPTPYSKPT